jgi:hypothetical protein
MRQPGSGHLVVPVLGLWVGGLVGLVTVIVSAVNAVCAPLALVMATSSMSALVAGLVGRTLPGARTAWWRGYRSGLEAGQTTKPDPNAKDSSLPRRR